MDLEAHQNTNIGRSSLSKDDNCGDNQLSSPADVLKELSKTSPNRAVEDVAHHMCGVCTDFFYENPNRILDVPTTSLKNYPRHVSENMPFAPDGRGIGMTVLQPWEQDYQKVRMGIQLAFHQARNNKKEWNKGKISAYLKSLSIGMRLVSSIVEEANDDSIDNPMLPASFHEANGVSLEQYVDALMHLFFHGCSKSIFACMLEWLGSINVRANFRKRINNLIQQYKTLRVEMLKLMPMSEKQETKLGAWMVEDIHDFVRIVKTMCEKLNHLITDDTSRHAYHWFLRLCISLNALTSQLMQDSFNDVDIQEVDMYIKLFLLDVDEFDKAACAEDRECPMWIGKGNFVSLLNIPTGIKLFGPPQLYWDGDHECFVQTVKPHVHGNYSTNGWLVTASNRIHATISLQLLMVWAIVQMAIPK